MKIINSIPIFKPIFGTSIDLSNQFLSVLVFLPNLASPYARSLAKELNDWIRPLDSCNASLVAISMTPVHIATDAIPRLLLKYPVVCDPEGIHFQGFDVQPAPLSGCIPRHLPRSGLARAIVEWRQAFRARGALFITESTKIIYEERWPRIDSSPSLKDVLETINIHIDGSK